MAGKVTVGLELHWSCMTELPVSCLSTYGLKACLGSLPLLHVAELGPTPASFSLPVVTRYAIAVNQKKHDTDSAADGQFIRPTTTCDMI